MDWKKLRLSGLITSHWRYERYVDSSYKSDHSCRWLAYVWMYLKDIVWLWSSNLIIALKLTLHTHIQTLWIVPEGNGSLRSSNLIVVSGFIFTYTYLQTMWIVLEGNEVHSVAWKVLCSLTLHINLLSMDLTHSWFIPYAHVCLLLNSCWICHSRKRTFPSTKPLPTLWISSHYLYDCISVACSVNILQD